MYDQLTEAVERAADRVVCGDYVAPPKVWQVGPDADIQFSDTPERQAYAGTTFTTWPKPDTHWTVD
jgi:hypothetical protein